MPDQRAKQRGLYWWSRSINSVRKAVGATQLLLVKDQPMLLSVALQRASKQEILSRDNKAYGQQLLSISIKDLGIKLPTQLTILVLVLLVLKNVVMSRKMIQTSAVS